MKCPSCGAAELIHKTRDLLYTYSGEATITPAVTGDFCPACRELAVDREHGDRSSELIGLFNRHVSAANGPRLHRQVTPHPDLDQHQAAELFRCGVDALSRYENSETYPALALVVKLLNVLDRHPNLLDELRTA